MTMLPPMPALTTANLLPVTACRWRAKSSGQRSSPLMVEAVPSVIESPNATMVLVPADALMSRASRKYQEVVEYGKPASSVRTPLFDALIYEVVSALACHVIGPVSPTTWKLTARRRPASIL